MTILAISGSLKDSSVNSAALRAAAAAGTRDGTLVTIDSSVGELPHFDPDLDSCVPEEVLRFRAACESSAGVLLSVPEYAFGIPGAFKNALDWTVASSSLYEKPVTLLNVAPAGRGAHVLEALDLVLAALAADVVHRSVPVLPGDRDEHGEICNPSIIDELRAAVAELAHRASVTGASRESEPASYGR
jgi:chromate reductase